jgi:hypothetical protein
MFKNYLTYNLVLSFHRSCLVLELPSTKLKERLMKSSEQMIHQFTSSLHAKDSKDEARFLFSTLISLRDCLESLREAGTIFSELESQFVVIQARLEQLCLKAATKENGQTRMLG